VPKALHDVRVEVGDVQVTGRESAPLDTYVGCWVQCTGKPGKVDHVMSLDTCMLEAPKSSDCERFPVYLIKE
jgi:hypothetical protein